MLGIGKAGANVAESFVTAAKDSPLAQTGFSALAIDIGDAELGGVRSAADGLPAGQVRTVSLPAPDAAALFSGLRRYREFLKTEFPRYYWNPNYEPWLPNDIEVPPAGSHYMRAMSKAIYGVEYYQGREVANELDAFVAGIEESQATPIVCVVFSLADGTGIGIVVELARHLSNIKLGRRPWVLGLGILPCYGDPDSVRVGRLFPVINELDCMVDAEKNKGVMTVWGDLYKNPFTAGFFAVPQNAVYERTGNLASTHEAVDSGLAAFLTRDGGAHPAAVSSRELTASAVPDFAEVRLYGPSADTAQATEGLPATTVAPVAVAFGESSGPAGSSVFVPNLSKLDLEFFVPTRTAYDGLEWEEKLMRHSWLLDLGVLLCEPSTRFEGVGGECILGCACWVVVPHAAIRGEADNLQLA